MPELTRRRSLEAPDECWHVYYGDVRVGTIAIRTGMPPHEDPWGWSCGFYPGSHPGECIDGTAATFDLARVEFEDAWRVFLSNRTEADFQSWRAQRDWTISASAHSASPACPHGSKISLAHNLGDFREPNCL
jgi:hypothetical protein